MLMNLLMCLWRQIWWSRTWAAVQSRWWGWWWDVLVLVLLFVLLFVLLWLLLLDSSWERWLWWLWSLFIIMPFSRNVSSTSFVRRASSFWVHGFLVSLLKVWYPSDSVIWSGSIGVVLFFVAFFLPETLTPFRGVVARLFLGILSVWIYYMLWGYDGELRSDITMSMDWGKQLFSLIVAVNIFFFFSRMVFAVVWIWRWYLAASTGFVVTFKDRQTGGQAGRQADRQTVVARYYGWGGLVVYKQTAIKIFCCMGRRSNWRQITRGKTSQS